MQQKAKEIDDNLVRAIEFSNRVDGVMELYKGIFAQMKKQRQQLPITMFLVRRKAPSASDTTPPAASDTPPAASDTPPAASPASPRATTPRCAVTPALSEASVEELPPLASDDEAAPEQQ